MAVSPISAFDVSLIGYPKCGNTWVQVMLRRALVDVCGLGDDWLSRVLAPRERLPAGVPAMEVTHAMPAFNDECAEQLHVDVRVFASRKVVLLVRDAADAMVSLYMHNVHREQTPLFAGDCEAMVCDPVYGLDKYLRFYRACFDSRHLPGELLLLRYEDLRRDPVGEVARLLTFLFGEVSRERLVHDVVAFGDFDRMQRMEADNSLGLATMAPAAGGEQARKVRRGLVGGAVEHLSARTLAGIRERVHAELPGWYGYGAAEATCRS